MRPEKDQASCVVMRAPAVPAQFRVLSSAERLGKMNTRFRVLEEGVSPSE